MLHINIIFQTPLYAYAIYLNTLVCSASTNCPHAYTCVSRYFCNVVFNFFLYYTYFFGRCALSLSVLFVIQVFGILPCWSLVTNIPMVKKTKISTKTQSGFNVNCFLKIVVFCSCYNASLCVSAIWQFCWLSSFCVDVKERASSRWGHQLFNPHAKWSLLMKNSWGILRWPRQNLKSKKRICCRGKERGERKRERK